MRINTIKGVLGLMKGKYRIHSFYANSGIRKSVKVPVALLDAVREELKGTGVTTSMILREVEKGYNPRESAMSFSTAVRFVLLAVALTGFKKDEGDND